MSSLNSVVTSFGAYNTTAKSVWCSGQDTGLGTGFESRLTVHRKMVARHPTLKGNWLRTVGKLADLQRVLVAREYGVLSIGNHGTEQIYRDINWKRFESY